jgi:hypothetical protein
MERIRLSGMGVHTPANLTCGACGVHIIKKGDSQMPIYYKDADGATYCPGCRADVELADRPELLTALDAKGRNIITVLSTLDKAAEAIKAELVKNPSRMPYLPKWEQGGRRVRKADGTELALGAGCPACSGKVNPVDAIPDLTGVCSSCGGMEVSEHSTLGTRWCSCGADHTEQLYYWRPDGSHGWLCTACHGITQTG